ncbi:RYamide receptor [Anabrus simplex]|uniref:RYamide receptor n=1 Tax=Anabrus simplex TaxID=316456 RepID=UPI0035A38C73
MADLSMLLGVDNSTDWTNLTLILKKKFNLTTDLNDLLAADKLEMLEPSMQTALAYIYTLTAVISIAGNLTVIAVLSLGKRSSNDLRAFLINLAVSDISMAVFSIPFTYTIFLLGRWIFHPSFCTVVLVMQHVSVIVSVYTLAAIGLDRYNAIMHPFSRSCIKSSSKMIVSGIWVTAFLLSAVQMHVGRAEQFRYGGEVHWSCEERWDSPVYSKVYTVAVFSVTFALPLLVISFTYTSIVIRMWFRISPGNADPNRDLAQLRSKKKIIKMLVAIVVLFAVCWLPLQTFLLLYYFVPRFGFYRNDHERTVYALSFVACHWLANANSLVNPLVYCFMSENFRSDLKEMIALKWRSSYGQPQPRDSLRSNSTRATTCLVQRTSSGSSSGRRAEVTFATTPSGKLSPPYK